MIKKHIFTQLAFSLIISVCSLSPLYAEESDEGFEGVWNALDADQNGFLTWEEVKGWGEHWTEELFKLKDENDDGKVTKEEFKSSGERLVKLLREPQDKTILLLGAIDTPPRDHKISKKEWKDWWDPADHKYFDMMDTNKDGFVVKSELEAYIKKYKKT